MTTNAVMEYRAKLASLTPHNKQIWDLAHCMMNEMMHSENADLQNCFKASARHHDASRKAEMDLLELLAIPAAQPAPFAMPEELMGGAVKLIRPTDLRNRIGMFMVEEYNLHIGSKVDAGKVQDMIEKFVSRELDAQPRKENP